ncbi:hypothetical protein AX774_g600 [Zancudomyces culisetae]|uniref:Uncharacterized protein n=1 Tax=Zancudomyces culisetae TaxID=1213189 RepID=A0A1R1PXZ4_ZANCU|nr:hypothetical protein AX774_g600 [Zancudomyces culisetae]|eukprot:OMH85841.1 hypothetical protein AX774_g600 [Zancudomyces culisetae]
MDELDENVLVKAMIRTEMARIIFAVNNKNLAMDMMENVMHEIITKIEYYNNMPVVIGSQQSKQKNDTRSAQGYATIAEYICGRWYPSIEMARRN